MVQQPVAAALPFGELIPGSVNHTIQNEMANTKSKYKKRLRLYYHLLVSMKKKIKLSLEMKINHRLIQNTNSTSIKVTVKIPKYYQS